MDRLRNFLLNPYANGPIDLISFAVVILVGIYATEGVWRFGAALASGIFFAALCAVIDIASGRR